MKFKKDAVLFVHDVWDGKLCSEVRAMSLGFSIMSHESGYTKKKLGDYILTYQPIAIIVSTPCFDWPLVEFYEAYTKNHPTTPILFAVNRHLCQSSQPEWNMFWPKRSLVLGRRELTGLSLMQAIYSSHEAERVYQ